MERGKGPGPGTAGTVLRRTVWANVGLYAAFVLVGTAIGWGLVPLAEWLVTLGRMPLRGAARAVVWLPGAVPPVVGALAGAALAGVAQYEELVVRLTADEVVLRRGGREHVYPRTAVALACRDGERLVLLGHDGGELARENCDADGERLRAAFAGQGWEWADADPHRAEFRRWVPGAADLPAAANALLAARQKVVKSKGAADEEAIELREELARLGVVVRDEKRRQYWRVFG